MAKNQQYPNHITLYKTKDFSVRTISHCLNYHYFSEINTVIIVKWGNEK